MNTITSSMPYTSPPTSGLARAAEIAGAVRLTDVAPTSIRWLWPGRIPLGRVTLLVSDPGLGKSLLTLDIAARVSTGAPWLDHASSLNPEPRTPNPSSVLLLTAEDDLADTVRPRLEALGADCDKILAISTVPGENSTDSPGAFTLSRDLARLRNLLEAIPDCRLLVIDPVSAYLGGTNEQSNAEVRLLLGALATLARERQIAVLIVSHLRKKDGAAIYRTMGSLAFVASARAAWILVKDTAVPNKRLLLPLKNNLAQGIAGLAYTIESAADNRTPVIHWSPDPVTTNVEFHLATARTDGRPDHERQHAIQWLRQLLSTGPRSTRNVYDEAAAHGISPRTLRRAFCEINGQAVREGPFLSGHWMWKLPGKDGQNQGAKFWPSSQFPDVFANRPQPGRTSETSTVTFYPIRPDP